MTEVDQEDTSERSALHERAYRDLRSRLIDGQLTPGQVVLAGELADSMSISVTPVREAIQRLIGEGSLEPLPNGNVRVRVFSEQQLDEWWAIRTLLESLAIAKAATRAEPSRLSVIASVNRAATAALDAGDVVEFGRLNRRFHFLCYEMAGSAILTEIIDGLWEKAGPYIVMAIPAYVRAHVAGEDRPLMAAHEEILSALAAGDGRRAAMALRRDIGMTAKWQSFPVALLMQDAVAAMRIRPGGSRFIGPNLGDLRDADTRPDAFQRMSTRPLSASSSWKRRRTEQTRALEAIRSALVSGSFLPGEHITVRALSDRFGLGAMPLREALREITSEGALEKLENGRLRVRVLPDEARLDLLELRVLLEAVAAAAAVKAARPGLLGRLEKLRMRMGRLAESGEPTGLTELRQTFVETLCRSSGLSVVGELLGRIWVLLGPAEALHRSKWCENKLLGWHDDVLSAVRANDPAAMMRLIVQRDGNGGLGPVGND